MGFTAFNSSEFPRVSPWECFSVEWFDVLINDNKLMDGLRNSVVIGVGVVLLSVPIGMAGALMLTQVSARVRPWYYTIVISPILVPGVVLGISTLIFWDRLGTMFGASHESLFYDGIFLTIVGQSTFISAYTMLVFISRLQRFDPALEEAALDLGATHVQTFRRILLPFLKPAIGSAAVLAFLASFENYNTTVFTIVSESTLTTVLASKVRYGINPSISALAVIIVALTLFGAAVFEVLKRRELAAQRESARVARGEIGSRRAAVNVFLDPALLLVVAVTIAGVGTVYFAGTIGLEECKAAVKAEKKRQVEQRIRERRARQMFQRAAPSSKPSTGDRAGSAETKIKAKGTEGYQGIFAPSNLEGQVKSGEANQEEDNAGAGQRTSPNTKAAPGTEGYRSIFAPSNLQGQVKSEEDESEKEPPKADN